jgi:hypothetical protein
MNHEAAVSQSLAIKYVATIHWTCGIRVAPVEIKFFRLGTNWLWRHLLVPGGGQSTQKFGCIYLVLNLLHHE